MNRPYTRTDTDILVELRGDATAEAADYVRAEIMPVLSQLSDPVPRARIKLTVGRHPTAPRSVLAEATVDLNGRLVRAQVAASTMNEAIDLLKDRLASRLLRIFHRREATRHRDEPAHRPDQHPRSPEKRAIVRRKSFTIPPESLDDAVFEMEAMDHDFHLFTDATTGCDSVVYRGGPTGYRVARTKSLSHRTVPNRGPGHREQVIESTVPAPRHTVGEATRRLELTGLPFVFFVDPTTGRGNILYHRRDGHYGLITPAE